MNSALVAHPPNPETLELVAEERFKEVQTVVYIRAVQLNRLPEIVSYAEGGLAVTIHSAESSVTLPAVVPEVEGGIYDNVTGEMMSTGVCPTYHALWDDISLLLPGAPYKGDGPTYLPYPFEFPEGVKVTVHSGDGSREYGSALCKGSEECTLLSYPRGNVQVLFRVYHCCDGEVVYSRHCERRPRTPPPQPEPSRDPTPDPVVDDVDEAEPAAPEGEAQADGAEQPEEEASAVQEPSEPAPSVEGAVDQDRFNAAKEAADRAEKVAVAEEAKAAVAEQSSAALEGKGAEPRAVAHKEAAAAWLAAACAEKAAADAETDLAQVCQEYSEANPEEVCYAGEHEAAKERALAATARMNEALERARQHEAKATEAAEEVANLEAAADAATTEALEAEQAAEAAEDNAIAKRDASSDAEDTREALSAASNAFFNAANRERSAGAAQRQLGANQVDGSKAFSAANDADTRAAEAERRAAELRPSDEAAPEEPTKRKGGDENEQEGGGCLC